MPANSIYDTPVTQKQFLVSVTLTWMYIFILVISVTDDPGPGEIALLIGAFVMYFAQVLALLKMRKATRSDS